METRVAIEKMQELAERLRTVYGCGSRLTALEEGYYMGALNTLAEIADTKEAWKHLAALRAEIMQLMTQPPAPVAETDVFDDVFTADVNGSPVRVH